MQQRERRVKAKQQYLKLEIKRKSFQQLIEIFVSKQTLVCGLENKNEKPPRHNESFIYTLTLNATIFRTNLYIYLYICNYLDVYN